MTICDFGNGDMDRILERINKFATDMGSALRGVKYLQYPHSDLSQHRLFVCGVLAKVYKVTVLTTRYRRMGEPPHHYLGAMPMYQHLLFGEAYAVLAFCLQCCTRGLVLTAP